jgi:hypothetical protein
VILDYAPLIPLSKGWHDYYGRGQHQQAVEQMPKVPAAAGFMVHLSSDPSTSLLCVWMARRDGQTEIFVVHKIILPAIFFAKIASRHVRQNCRYCSSRQFVYLLLVSIDYRRNRFLDVDWMLTNNNMIPWLMILIE